MGKSRNSYHMMDDNSYELLQQFEPAIEIPSDDEIEKDTKPEISPKLHQRLMDCSKRDPSPSNVHQSSNNKSQNNKPPKLRAIPHSLNLMEIHNLISRSTGGETTISPAPLHHNSQQQNSTQQTLSSNLQSYPKRRRTDEVTTTACGASSNDEFPSESGNFPTSSNNDDDYHFLMSLQPYLTQFTGPQKLRIRMRIQKLIFKELYKDELDE